MSNCNKISELLSAYMDGELTTTEKELVEKHLESCASCKQKLDVMLKTKDILKLTPQVPVPETLLKDFEEYRKKSEQTEKKVVPFYKNYRVYASIAAIFVFAFVLKSGLWQEDKFVPDTLTQIKVAEQTIDAPNSDNENVANKNDSAEETQTEVASKKADPAQPAKKQKSVEPEENAQTQHTKARSTEVITTNVVNEAPVAISENVQAVAEPQVESENPVAADPQAESTGVSPMARTIDAPPQVTEEVKTPANAIVYVSEEHLEKAARLLSEGTFFYAQVEQKLSDNRIPFESNFLSLDESVPHRVVVMVRE